MSGKPYTMREMKGIVEYLVEHKAYNEIKGRKMWMNFASSQMTTRTWQSLKETFLKRILPDIHNPYYKLTIEQARSFKEGRDYETNAGNKLEIHTSISSSNSNIGENQKNGDQPSTSKAQPKEVEVTTGEVIKSAKIPSEPRSSADTVVLETYYNTAEEIENVLENNIDSERNKEEVNKNIRDCLTFEYSPFNIDAMKVLEDFATESEGSDKEPKMEIDENPTRRSNGVKPENKEHDKVDDAPIEISDCSDSENVEKDSNEVNNTIEELNNDTNEKHSDKADQIIEEERVENTDTEKHNSLTDKQKEPTEDQDNLVIENEKPVDSKIAEDKSEYITAADNTESSDTIIPPNKTASPKKSIEHVPNSFNTQTATNSTDASLPNNQEALNGVTNTQTKLNTSEDKIAKSNPRKRSTSTDTNTSKKVKLNDEKSNNTEKNEKDVVNPSTQEKINVEANDIVINTENLNNAVESQNNKELSKKDQLQANNDDIKDNPCLISVSLHAEQFNTTKYSDSENEIDTVHQQPQENTDKVIKELEKADDKVNEAQINVDTKSNKPPAITDNKLNQTQPEVDSKIDEPKENAENTSNKKPHAKLSLKKPNEPTKKDNKSNNKNEIIVLKSHSESSSDKRKPGHSKGKVSDDTNKSRTESALANMLGFLGGGNRKRKISHRRSRTERRSMALTSDSSEWTSESDEEYVSPPRGRKNRHTKKYLKPKSARILSLEEEGGLVVMYGKRLFPVVRDGGSVKNYVAINSTDSNSEDDDSYWRQKYVEEKIRADKLEKRLKESNKPDPTLKRKSPILQSNTLLRNMSSHKPHNESVNDAPKIEPISKEALRKQFNPENLKICVSKDNQEVRLEGNWSSIHPALDQVVRLIYSEPDDTKIKPSKSSSVRKTENSAINGQEHEAVEKSSINGQELETVLIDSASGMTTPITSSVDPEIHKKISEIENEIFKEIEDLESKAKEEELQLKPVVEDDSNVTKRPSRGRPRKSLTLKAKSIQKEKIPKPAAKETRKDSKSDKIVEKQNGDRNETTKDIEKTLEKQNGGQNELAKNIETISNTSKRSSRATKSVNEPTIESNGVTTRRSASRKRESILTVNDEENVRYMFPPNNTKQTNKTAKRSLTEACTQDVSIRSIDSAQGYQDSDFSPILTKRKKRERKSSYRVHSSKRPVRRKSLPDLTAMLASDSSNSSYFVPLRKTQSTLNSEVYRTDSYQLLVPQTKTVKVLQSIKEDEIGDEIRHFDSVSKNVSERSSPCNVLVEIGSSSNVSLPMSPELSVVENLTISREIIKNVTLNETCNVGDENLDYNKYVMSDVDVSYPLMAGQCELQQSNNVKSSNSVDKNLPAKNVAQVIEEKSISDTINKKLHDLLLESAKKMTGKENMEVDETDEAIEIPKKTRAKKRCSTPRKRKSGKNKAPVNPVIEEEHMESCSFSGRKSCPPLINIVTPEDNVNTINVTTKVKGKNKKDIIKVKIQRPKSRSNDSRKSKDSTKTSILTDSGINETGCLSGMFLKGNDSVDLIHNHSDTCLHANECIGDSLEFVENSKSIISLNNSSDSELMKLIDDAEMFSGVLDCNDAQDGFLNRQPLNEENFYSAAGTEYNSPINTNSSLITEDLSDEIPSQPTKWYLLSEDDTNTNMAPPTNNLARSFGANLNQIFTSCAVPNLSTITENSNDSRKVNMETDVQNSDSQI